MRIGNREFDVKNHIYIMGILNVTPDSFSDGGQFDSLENAKLQVQKMIEEGVDVIDVGGESTRPGHTVISDEEEISRVVPVIRMIKENFDIPVSIDTYKSAVAKAAIEAGADMVNDIWGLKKDEKMAGIIADSGVACCLMHNRIDAEYENFIEDMLADLADSVKIALDAGIKPDKMILDPGIGFAKDYEQNLEAIRCMEEFHKLGYPMLLATSRKSVIGLTLDLPVTERLEGTLATTVMAVMKGYSFVRVHDVKENKRAITMTEKVLQCRK